jgi:pilus assembly protein CpaF
LADSAPPPESSPEPAALPPVDAPAPEQPVPEAAPVAEEPEPSATSSNALFARVQPLIAKKFDKKASMKKPRRELFSDIEAVVVKFLKAEKIELETEEQRELILELCTDRAGPYVPRNAAAARDKVDEAKGKIQGALVERIDVTAAAKMPRGELARQVGELVAELLVDNKIHLNLIEQRDLITMLLNDMLGLGPLEPLLADDAVTDILVNGPFQIYVERKGKLELSDVKFRDNGHVMSIAQRIVTRVGRRIDESQPLVDARLEDGSRVNVIAPPLAIDGTSISIRKFAKQKITLDKMVEQNNLSPELATVLKIASACRLNVLISGGTGSGKTTLLNAMSQLIDHGERIVTIEDAAELQLQQPHVVRLETRPANLEGDGEITMRDLVKNSLRMRPDRIILGEMRGSEALDVLQAMNTGHDGSMSTIHANRPREALTRLENMVGMGGINLPSKAVRTQIASAVQMIVQVSRMRDGMRRIVSVMEVVGMEGDVITTQDLFNFEFQGESTEGKLLGEFKSTGLRPHFAPRAEYFGLDRALLEAMA